MPSACIGLRSSGSQLIDTPALNEQWRTRLVQRRGWLIQQLG
jgi:hypothetical protein